MFYNYVYLDPRRPGKFTYPNVEMCFLYEPMYVGKGTKKRYLEHLKKNKRVDNPLFRNKINFLRENDMKPYIIVFNHTDDEELAYKNEELIIESIGSEKIKDIQDGPLTNVCIGNSPPSLRGRTYKEIYGEEHYQEQIEKRRQLQLDAGGWFGGRKHTPESKEKIGAACRGEKHPNWGKHHSKETIERIRKARLASPSYNFIKFKVTSPDGEEFIIEDGLKEFCIEQQISYSTLRKCLKTYKVPNRGKTKDWYLEYYNEE